MPERRKTDRYIFTSYVKEAMEFTGRSAREVIERLLIRGVAFGKDEAPVRTGALRRDVQYELDPDPKVAGGVFGNSLFYAPFVNLGTRFMRANPYLLRALYRLFDYAKGAVAHG